MHYSLSRFRTLQPKPPFTLGGRYHRDGETHWLVDAEGAVEIKGDWSTLKQGDLILVSIARQDGALLEATLLTVYPTQWSEARFKAKPHAPVFAHFVQEVRQFFFSKGLKEVFTPALVTCPGLEPTLIPFMTQVQNGRALRRAYLPTSPEIHLKKAMASDWTDLFEIKTCFRNNEFTKAHEAEFTMLEWYRGFADLGLVIADLTELLGTFANETPVETDFASLFWELLQFRLTPATSRQELLELAQGHGIHTREDDSFTDLFHALMLDKIEPTMALRGPLIVRRFPPAMAALAKLDAEGWADRFELYWNGLEIANAFNEVVSENEQQLRWAAEQSERERLKTGTLPLDMQLFEALQQGLPPTGGIALGLER